MLKLARGNTMVTIYKQSLIYLGPVIWNNLPDCLKNLETVDSFHRHFIKWMKSSLSFNL